MMSPNSGWLIQRPKYYHSLHQKEKELESHVWWILPNEIAASVFPSGSKLAHLYGLPKTHKKQLAMRPVLSATQRYNFALAKWLDHKLKPLANSQYMTTDTFEFVNKVHTLTINNGDVLVSYDFFIIYQCAFGRNHTLTCWQSFLEWLVQWNAPP